ncbi:MAG: Fur family transcriptional regulator, partial [Shimia sp.]
GGDMGQRGEALRAQMLEIMQAAGRPLSAYDLLAELSKTTPKIAPPTVYRALAALTKDGRAHRIESMNAYVPCSCDDHDGAALMSICDDCGTVQETAVPGVVSALAAMLDKSGFAAERHVLEIHGTCATCAEGTA